MAKKKLNKKDELKHLRMNVIDSIGDLSIVLGNIQGLLMEIELDPEDLFTFVDEICDIGYSLEELKRLYNFMENNVNKLIDQENK
jgi:hypothetical protein